MSAVRWAGAAPPSLAERELPAAAIELVGCVERDACGRAVDDDPSRPAPIGTVQVGGHLVVGEHRPGRDAIRHRPAAEDRIADEPPDDQDRGKRGQDHGRQVGDLRQRRRHALREQARVGKSSAIQRVLELGHGGRLLRPHPVGGRDAPYVHRQSVGWVRRAHDHRATLITGKVFPAVAIGSPASLDERASQHHLTGLQPAAGRRGDRLTRERRRSLVGELDQVAIRVDPQRARVEPVERSCDRGRIDLDARHDRPQTPLLEPLRRARHHGHRVVERIDQEVVPALHRSPVGA